MHKLLLYIAISGLFIAGLSQLVLTNLTDSPVYGEPVMPKADFSLEYPKEVNPEIYSPEYEIFGLSPAFGSPDKILVMPVSTLLNLHVVFPERVSLFGHWYGSDARLEFSKFETFTATPTKSGNDWGNKLPQNLSGGDRPFTPEMHVMAFRLENKPLHQIIKASASMNVVSPIHGKGRTFFNSEQVITKMVSLYLISHGEWRSLLDHQEKLQYFQSRMQSYWEQVGLHHRSLQSKNELPDRRSFWSSLFWGSLITATMSFVTLLVIRFEKRKPPGH